MAGTAVRITNEISQVGGPGLTAAEDAAIYLVNFAGHAALIDAGCGGGLRRLWANVEAAGVRPERIELLLATHCHFDHAGGLQALRERLGCPVVMHERDADFLERGDDLVTAAGWYDARIPACVVDRRLAGATDEIVLGERPLIALHIPGHSPGSVAYVAHSAGRKVVFAQDVHGPLHPDLLSNAEDYQASLRKLLDLDADILCEGHYGVFAEKAEAARFIRSFMM